MAARKLAKKRKGPKRVVRRSKPPEREEPAPAAPPASRPTRYAPPLGERILERLSNGETATQICHDPEMPRYPVLKRWERDNEEFAKRYAVARKQCCEYHTDEIIAIADDSTNDYVDRLTAKGKVYRVFDREHFERSKLRVHARQWEASKILRHVYGERAEVDLRTPDGINMQVEERNSLIDALCKLVHPKKDGQTKPDKHDEPRER